MAMRRLVGRVFRLRSSPRSTRWPATRPRPRTAPSPTATIVTQRRHVRVERLVRHLLVQRRRGLRRSNRPGYAERNWRLLTFRYDAGGSPRPPWRFRPQAWSLSAATSPLASFSPAAAMFSSRWATEPVPGMGSIDRRPGEQPGQPPGGSWRRAARRSRGRAALPSMSLHRRPREERHALQLAAVEHRVELAVDEVVAVLHATRSG